MTINLEKSFFKHLICSCLTRVQLYMKNMQNNSCSRLKAGGTQLADEECQSNRLCWARCTFPREGCITELSVLTALSSEGIH